MQLYDRARSAQFFRSRRCVALAVSIALFSAGGGAFAQTETTPTEASASIINQHALAQQGLTIGLAAGLAQSQLALLSATPQVGKCKSVRGGGSIKALQATLNGTKATLIFEIYYDNACSDRYINANVKADKTSATTLLVTETATLYGLTGGRLGKLALSESLKVFAGGGSIDQLSATGAFTPTGLSTVDIGFDCGFPSDIATDTTMTCHVGIAQTLASTGGDIASVTPLAVKVTSVSPKATFIVKKAELARGDSGMLGISAPTNHSLQITGAHIDVGTAFSSGTFSVFSIFPKGPSSWISTDTGNGLRFSIALAKGGTTLTGAIKKLSNDATLATFSVDKSGTGSITYSNGKSAKIKSWILAD